MLARQSKIMVVDDATSMRMLMVGILKQFGYTAVEQSGDGADAWPVIHAAAAAGEPFGLVISDWHMPAMPGIDLLRQVRSAPATRDTRFMLVTGEEESHLMDQARDFRVDSYITKPFTPQAILSALHAL